MMTETHRGTKRVLAVAVALATMAWAIGLATLVAPLSASAATIPSGSLVKGSLPAVYYVGANGKRFVFPNDKVFKTWYSDFSTVQKISDADLASLMIGGNVTYKPGLRMVKITSDNKTYAIAKGGVLRWVKTEAAAVALYGSTWNQQIDDIADVFFINYTVDGDINSAADYNKAQELANATSINADKGLDGSQPVSSGVTVSLSSKSPSSMSIPSTAFYAPLLTLSVKNTTSSQVNLTGLTVHRTGIIADSSVSGVLVTDSSGILHGTLVTFGQSVAQPGFGTDPIRIAAGATEDVTLSVNIGAVTSGTLGATISLASDLTFVDGNGAAVAVGGSFPISGSTMSVVDGTGSIGAVAVTTQTIIGGTSGAPIAIDQGAKNLDVAKFRISESSGSEDVELMNLEIQNNGSASAGDMSNIRLVDQDNQVVATVSGVVNNIAKFSILSMTGTKAGPHGGFKIPSGQQRDFTVRIDTSENTNSASRTINFTVQNSFRVRAVGVRTGVGVTPSAGGSDTYPIGDTEGGANWVAFRTGTLSVSRSTESLSGKITKGATNVALATFDVRAFGEPIEIQEIQYVVLNQSGAALAGSTRKSLVGTVKINNASGAAIFSKTATDATNYGGTCTISSNTFSGTCGGTGGTVLSTLSSFTTIQANSTGKLVFVADIDQNATSSDGYTVQLQSIKFRKVSSNTFDTTTPNIAGNGLTVETSTLTVNKSSSYNPTNLVKGGSLQKLASFDLQAGASEGQRVNALKVQVCTGTSALVDVATNCTGADVTATGISTVTNITLMQGATQLAPAQSITTAAGGTYSTQLTVNANTTIAVDVYGVVSSSYGPTNLGMALTASSFTGLSSQTTTNGTAVLGQDLTISVGGTLTVSSLGNDGVINVAKLLHAGESDVPLFKFKIRETTNAEAMTLGKLYLVVKNAQNTFSSYKLFNEATGQQIGSSNTAIISNGTNGEVRFGGLNLSIVKGGEMNLIVKGSVVDAATMASSNYDVLVTPSFVEYTGSVSGTTTRVSGGLVIGQHTADATGVAGTFTAGTSTQAKQVLTVASLPANSDTINIGACLVTFSTAGTHDTNCTGGATINRTTYNSAALVAGQLALLTNVTDALHNALVVYGTGSTATFVEAGAVASATNITFTDGTTGSAITNVATTGVIGTTAPSFLLVNDVSNFEVGDLVYLDVNKDGDFVDFTTSIKESQSYAVKTVGTNSIQLSQTTSSSGALLVPPVLTTGVPVVNYNFSSSNQEVQEVEPIVTGLNVGSGSMVSENEVGTFVIRNEGNRSLVVDTLKFEISGSYPTTSGAQTYGPRSFKLDRADPTTGARIANTMISGAALSTYTYADMAGTSNECVTFAASGVYNVFGSCTSVMIPVSGSVIVFDLDAAGLVEEIGGGSSKGYVVLADTTVIKSNSGSNTASTQVRMLGSKAVEGSTNAGLTWNYIRTSNGNSSGNIDISDSYIVSGKSITY
ncbi:MAG: hypothetical protein WCJ29_03620 [bacterium]